MKKCILYLCCLIAFTLELGACCDGRGKVIYLNGPSSAGKSTLARALQENLQEPFFHVGIDTFVAMMPENCNDFTGTRKETMRGFQCVQTKDKEGNPSIEMHLGPCAEKTIASFRSCAVLLVERGHNLIIDDVSFGNEDVALWRKALEGYDVVWVGLKAPVEVLEQREKSRGDRLIGMARMQLSKVHEGVTYDIVCDTSSTPLKENVKNIVDKLFTRT